LRAPVRLVSGSVCSFICLIGKKQTKHENEKKKLKAQPCAKKVPAQLFFLFLLLALVLSRQS
jgi:hypothetical protein